MTGEPVAASPERKQRHPLFAWGWSLVHLDFVGIAFGALFFCLSLTPSLLPRDWLFQGLIGGVNAAIGYGIGVFIQKMLHRFVLRRRTWWPPSKRVLYWCKAATITLSTVVGLLMLIPAAAWQRRVSAEMGMEGPDTIGYLRTLIVAMLVTGLCVSGTRVLIDLIKTMARFFIRRWHLHDEVALFIGTAIVVVLAITLINGVLVRGFLAGANWVFQPQNTTTRAAITQPLELERSGSPTSFAPWETLGYQGRNFVATGPHAVELTRLNGTPAKEPIRVYAGLQTADTNEERAAVLV
ncbi:MAG: alpha/beta-hydrolase N-terminal domain-containing protein, partial [Mycobacterium sp.]